MVSSDGSSRTVSEGIEVDGNPGPPCRYPRDHSDQVDRIWETDGRVSPKSYVVIVNDVATGVARMAVPSMMRCECSVRDIRSSACEEARGDGTVNELRGVLIAQESGLVQHGGQNPFQTFMSLRPARCLSGHGRRRIMAPIMCSGREIVFKVR